MTPYRTTPSFSFSFSFSYFERIKYEEDDTLLNVVWIYLHVRLCARVRVCLRSRACIYTHIEDLLHACVCARARARAASAIFDS